MAKWFLETKDNILEKKLLIMTKTNSFYLSDEVVTLKDNLIEFYAKMFLEGDLELAKKLIDPPGEKSMRRIDIAELWFYIGGMLPLIAFSIFTWYFR